MKPRRKIKRANRLNNTLWKTDQIKTEFQAVLSHIGLREEKITIDQGVILKSMRIWIPSAMRLEVLTKIHQGRQGITKCRERAKQAVWWPGVSTSRQIENMVSSCRVCATHRINKPEPLCPTVFPERPWQVVGTDLFYLQSVDYLLVVDYFHVVFK